MKRLERFWDVAYHPVRPYLLLRGLYLLLAGDVWLGMVEHGARYGAGGFNVAHFAWIERVVPMPSPAFYVGSLIFSGALAFMLALDPSSRLLRALLALCYTAGWLVSIHDSYQHHYLLSWLLTWCVACPSVRRLPLQQPTGQAGVPLGDREDGLVRGWGLPMTAMTCTIVYTFTGISKSEPEWRSGAVLKSLTHSTAIGDPRPGKFDGLRDLMVGIGIDEGLVWPLLALSTVALQWVIALGYLAAPARDVRPTPGRIAIVSIGLVGALSFHAVAELFEVFEIGIFSYYMIWIALVLLLPSSLLVPPARMLAELGAWADNFRAPLPDGPVGPWMALAAAGVLAATGCLIPLPGALKATLCVSAVAVGWTLLGGRSAAWSLRARDMVLTALVLWLTLAESDVPFDYYRRGAGELARMGRKEEALELYRQAEKYAPPGQSRRHRIEELERQLATPP
jgi:hypothetical protein